MVICPSLFPMYKEPSELIVLFRSSGDTGVSASLVLHGTPPFHVYYRTQRDKEPEEEGVKTFSSSRGEITLQPLWSGHYVYTFLRLSDANYQRVELNGPTISQVVHPLASAEFAYGETKRMINSCSGNIVNVDVLLRVCLVVLK
jgi:nucleoporin POM152